MKKMNSGLLPWRYRLKRAAMAHQESIKGLVILTGLIMMIDPILPALGVHSSLLLTGATGTFSIVAGLVLTIIGFFFPEVRHRASAN